MSKGSVKLVVVSLMLCVVAIEDRASAEPLRVMPLGDSITWGYPFQAAGGYRTRLWQDFGSDPARLDFLGSRSDGPPELGDKDHEGHSGYTIAREPGVFVGNITDRVALYLAATINPDVILLMIGSNDINFNYRADGAPGRLDHLVSLISDRSSGVKPNAYLIVASLPPINDADPTYRPTPTDFERNTRAIAFNATIPGIVAIHRDRGERVYFLDMNSQLSFADLVDGLHPTQAGYRKMADAWYNSIQNVPEPDMVLSAWAVGLAISCRSMRRAPIRDAKVLR